VRESTKFPSSCIPKRYQGIIKFLILYQMKVLKCRVSMLKSRCLHQSPTIPHLLVVILICPTSIISNPTISLALSSETFSFLDPILVPTPVKKPVDFHAADLAWKKILKMVENMSLPLIFQGPGITCLTKNKLY